MKVRELIALLAQQNQELDVVVDGYEGGYVDVKAGFPVITLMVDYHKDTWYYGEHEEKEGFHEWEGEVKQALLIPR